MFLNDAIYGETLIYGEFIYSSYENTYAPIIARFYKESDDRDNTFVSNSILNGYAVLNYRWKIWNERGLYLDQSGSHLNNIFFRWPDSGGRFTVLLIITDVLNRTSEYSQTYNVLDNNETVNNSSSIPVYEQHGFVYKKPRIIKVLSVFSCNGNKRNIKVISIEDKCFINHNIYLKKIELEE